MAARFLRNDLLPAVTRLMNAFHNLRFVQRRSNDIDVWDLHENERGSLLSGSGQRVGRIRLHALVRLVHQLNTAVVNRSKSDVITLGNLNGGFESEPLSPKLQAWFDGFNVQHWRGLIDHSLLLLVRTRYGDSGHCGNRENCEVDGHGFSIQSTVEPHGIHFSS